MVKDFSPERDRLVAGMILLICVVKATAFIVVWFRPAVPLQRMEGSDWFLAGSLWITYLVLWIKWSGLSRVLVTMLLANSMLMVARKEFELGINAELLLGIQVALWISAAVLSAHLLRVANLRLVQAEG
jgi:hypothetical protein